VFHAAVSFAGYESRGYCSVVVCNLYSVRVSVGRLEGAVVVGAPSHIILGWSTQREIEVQPGLPWPYRFPQHTSRGFTMADNALHLVNNSL